MDEPASDRIRPNVIVTGVVLVMAVVALVAAGFLMTRDSGDSVSAGDSTPATPPGTGPAGGTRPDTTTCNETAPVPRPRVEPTDDLTAELEAALVGCTEANVTLRAEAAGWTVRVVERNGEGLMVTMDYVPARLNLAVNDRVVTAASPG
jgi:hypothetical protein